MRLIYLITKKKSQVKKNFFVLTILVSLAACAFAQSVETTPSNESGQPVNSTLERKWSVGIDLAGTANIPATDVAFMTHMSYIPRIGLSYGAHVGYQPFKWLGFRTGLYSIAKNYLITRTTTINDVEFGSASMMLNTYLNVPFMADLSIGRKVRYHLFLGAYAGYWYKAKLIGSSQVVTIVDEGVLYNQDYEFNSTRDNRFDAGLNYGLGLSIPFSQRVGFNVEMLWYYGLTDIHKVYMREHSPFYNTTFLLQVGATFNL